MSMRETSGVMEMHCVLLWVVVTVYQFSSVADSVYTFIK